MKVSGRANRKSEHEITCTGQGKSQKDNMREDIMIDVKLKVHVTCDMIPERRPQNSVST